MKRLIIIGASGHGKVILDIAKRLDIYSEIVFVDDTITGYIDEVKVLTDTNGLLQRSDIILSSEIIVAIGNDKARQRIVESFTNVRFASLVHPSAVIANTVTIDEGCVVMANAVINSDAKIGKHCIINTSAVIDHDTVIGDYTHVSVGAKLAGAVHIGNHTWIGIGATISNNLEICDNCMIGAGTVVVKNISKSGTYVGVPARIIRR